MAQIPMTSGYKLLTTICTRHIKKTTKRDSDEDHLQDTMAAKIQSKIKVVKRDHKEM